MCLSVASTSVVTTTLSPAFTSVRFAFNCFTLTASVLFVPSATLVILLPPLSRPVFVNLTSVVVVPGVVGALIVMPSLLTLVPPTVKEPALDKSTSLFKLYLTTPSLPISAVVFVPFVKSKPFSNVTVLAPLPLALYVNGICLAALLPSNVTA